MKTKVAIIGTVGLPAKYGGFETLTAHLVEELADTYDFTVYCSSKKYTKEERTESWKGAKLKYLPLDANGIQSIPYDTLSILHALFRSDVLLVLGVAGAWLLPFVKLFTRKKIIISIDGIEWKRDKWSLPAKLYLWWAEKLAVRFSHIDISDNESIQDYTSLRYKTISRVIEYGADHTKVNLTPTSENIEKYPFLSKEYAVKVCRIEPENNVHTIVKVFSELPDRTLVLVGNWKNSQYGIDVKQQYSDYENIHLLDPIYDQELIDLIRGNASVYIHGHSAGGTNPSLVEAMFLGLPIISNGVSYNRTTTEHQAFYFSNEEDLKNVLTEITKEDLRNCAVQMKKIAERRYTWKKIAKKYSQLIEETFTVNKKTNVYPVISKLDKKILEKYNLEHLKNIKLFNSSNKTA
jgi:glycosyltransferase involved in cell wall biosynthesis